jgi:hypothetical protein
MHERLTGNRDYATKVFGFATFGRIYGMLICISGLMNLSQSGLDALTHGPLDGNPAPINISIAVMGTLLAMALSAYITISGWNFHNLKRNEVEHGETRHIINVLETVEEEEE